VHGRIIACARPTNLVGRAVIVKPHAGLDPIFSKNATSWECPHKERLKLCFSVNGFPERVAGRSVRPQPSANLLLVLRCWSFLSHGPSFDQSEDFRTVWDPPG